MQKFTQREINVAKDWVEGKITQAEATRRLKKQSFVGGYIALALILKALIKR